MTGLVEIQKALGVTADGILGPKTLQAIYNAIDGGTYPKLADNKAHIKHIQHLVGATEDGIWGPKTASALASALARSFPAAKPNPGRKKIFIDPGHTADRAREWPSTFTKVDWTSGKYAEVAKLVGFNAKTQDSVEHMLNVLISKHLKDVLEARGVEVVYYDAPSLSNNAEICNVCTKSNATKPDAFVSIHNNAVGSKGWESMSCSAAGSVALCCASRSAGKKLATLVAKRLEAYRKAQGGPDNRKGNIVNTSSVAVLSKAPSCIPATLVEVCFYDNIDDLLFAASHAKGIAEVIADGVMEYFTC